MRELIRSLNPRPGASFAKDEANYVIPDVVVRKVRSQWIGVAQRGGDAQAAPQPHLRRHPDAQPRVVEPAARRAAAGSEVADPQRAAALRDHPARGAGDRRAAAPLLRARRGRDAADGAARDRRHARPARVDDLARDDAEVHADAARHLRAQVFLRQPRRHRHRRRGLGHRDPRADQAAGRGREPASRR